jgi:hypothetical protein
MCAVILLSPIAVTGHSGTAAGAGGAGVRAGGTLLSKNAFQHDPAGFAEGLRVLLRYYNMKLVRVHYERVGCVWMGAQGYAHVSQSR